MNPWRVAGILCLISAEALIVGYSLPFFTLALEKRELADWLIGLNASFASAGAMLVAPFLPRLISKFDIGKLVAGLFAVSFISFAAIMAVDNIVVWFVSRLIVGACFGALWTIGEIWIGQIVDRGERTQIINASTTLYATIQFFGALLFGVVATTGTLALAVAMVPLGLGVALAFSANQSIRISTADKKLANPTGGTQTMAIGVGSAAFTCGFCKFAMLGLLPLHGLAHGFDIGGAALLVAVFIFGEAVLVAPLGWVATHKKGPLALRICTIVAILATALVPFTPVIEILHWLVLFIAGGAISGIYTIATTLAGQDSRAKRPARSSNGWANAFSFGAIVGPVSVAVLIDLIGVEALPISVLVVLVGLSVQLLAGERERRHRIANLPSAGLPNLTYLEDSHFDEDEPTNSPEYSPEPSAVSEYFPHAGSEDFKPHHATAASKSSDPATSAYPSAEDFKPQPAGPEPEKSNSASAPHSDPDDLKPRPIMTELPLSNPVSVPHPETEDYKPRQAAPEQTSPPKPTSVNHREQLDLTETFRRRAAEIAEKSGKRR